jgi:hypothetical protein
MAANGFWLLALGARWVLGYNIEVENINALRRLAPITGPMGRGAHTGPGRHPPLLGKVQGPLHERSAGGSLRYYKRELLVSGGARLHGIRRAGPVQQQEQ